MRLFRSADDAGQAGTTPRVPRDVESLEKLVKDLEQAGDEASTWRIAVDSIMESHGFRYGAVWLPDDHGAVQLGYEGATSPRPCRRRWPGARCRWTPA